MGLGPFTIVEPTHDTPVLVEVPHAGLRLDGEALGCMIAPCRNLARDADLYVDEIFGDAPSCGASLLTADVSRYVVDLNRAEDDFDGAAVAGGPAGHRPRGVIWSVSSDGQPVLSQPLPAAEYERRMTLYHRPYHRALSDLLERKRARFGFALALCAHSMPTPRRRERGHRAPAPALADLVPGSRGRTSAAGRFIDCVEQVGRRHGFTVVHDDPYKGGYTTTHYGRPDAGCHVVQLEIARALYMDEEHLGRVRNGLARLRQFAGTLVSELVVEADRVYRSGGEDDRTRR
ncbi:MAG: N-formylglutamate amidohydrolase [Myxococcales bacterium]|nr:N-formylglutamate amidohydrolase [Myxococcales bacterium]